MNGHGRSTFPRKNCVITKCPTKKLVPNKRNNLENEANDQDVIFDKKFHGG